MPDLTAKLPRALAERTVFASLAEESVEFAGHRGVPALLAHPDEGWVEQGAPKPTPRPVVIWMHGRSVHKELDPGRYLRWLRAPGGGIASCALDLPGHGERFVDAYTGPDHTLEVVEEMAGEIDHVVEALADPRWRGAFDLDRMGIGGMSAGGMTTLHRLSREHPFLCASVEATAGDFSFMQHHNAFVTCGGRDPDCELADRLDPVQHLEGWRPIPLLALHSEKDQWVPAGSIESFIEKVRTRYDEPADVELVTWPETGAWQEHAGFGRFSNDAKNIQREFFARHLPGVAG